LIRRSISRPSQLAFYLCHTPRPAPLSRLVKVAGARWAVEECFQAAKNEAGMDQYQVRRYEPWYRYGRTLQISRARIPPVPGLCRVRLYLTCQPDPDAIP